MKAAVFDKYGPPEVLHIEQVAKPTPKDNEILVKVYTSTVTAGDSRIRGARFPKGFGLFAKLAFGVFKPSKRILGSSFSGIVESVGKDVRLFKEGDEVFGMTGFAMATYAEFVTIAENKAVIKKPEDMSHSEASAMPFGATTALFFLRNRAKIQKDQKILINGASGAVGTSAVQIAKFYGAHVTGVCSTENIELVKSLGADIVIDYTKEDIYKNNAKYDIVMDTVGNISIDQCKDLLTENGTHLLVVGSLSDLLKANFGSKKGKKLLDGTAPEKKEDLEFLVELFNKGMLKVVIDKTYTLEDIVDAHRRVDAGHKKGNVVISIT